MKLLLKISLSLIILLIIAVIGFATVFDPNDYKKELITLVKDKTGRELSIPGDISLSFFPWIGIDLGAIKISNAKGFGKQPFAQMSHLQVRVKLLPLFKQQLEADTIVIDGLELNLAKNKQGVNNWDDFTTTKTSQKTSAKTDKQKDSDPNMLAAIALNGIKIQNAQFNWHDQQQKQKISIKDVQLSIGELRPATKVPFNLQFHLQEKTLDARIKFKSEIIFSSDLKQFSFYDTQLASELKLATLKQHLTPQFNSALMQLDLDKQTFNTKELNLSENSLKLQTRVSAEKLLSSPYINSHITLHTFNLRNIAENFEIKLPDMADKKTLTQLSAQLDIKGSLKKIELTNIELSLDDTNIVGNAKLKPMPGSSTVNLVVDNINLDRYLPEPTTTDKKTEPSKKTKEAVLIPVALLSAFNADASVKIKKLQIKKTHWENLNLVAHAKNGKTHIKPLTVQGYAATIKSDFIIKAVKNNALLSGNLNIKNIKAGKLLNDLTGKDKLKGQTTIVASFNTSGIKLSQLKQNLNGKLKLNLKDGTLKGFDLNHQLNVLNAKIEGKATPVAPKPAETKIAKLNASAVIKKGILNNKDLRASTPLSRIAGRGTVDIAKEKINYTASVKFTSSTDIKASTSYEEMKAIPLDIHIGGSFDEPKIKVDFQKVLKQLVKKEIKKHESKIKEKAKEDLQKKIDDKLKKLLKF